MIIKQSRILVGDAEKFAEYLRSEGDNENIRILKGNPDDVSDFEFAARYLKRSYATRHVMISPQKALDRNQLKIAIAMIAKEFGINDYMINDCIVVVHKKARATEPSHDLHYHIAFPEHDAAVHSSIDTKFLHLRCEVVSRKLEIMFGHPIVVGAANKPVFERLEREGFDTSRFKDALIQEAENLGMSRAAAEESYLGIRRRAGFDHKKNQALRKSGLNAGELTKRLRAIITENKGILSTPKRYAAAVRDRIHEFGAQMYYDPNSGILGFRFGDRIVPGLKKMLGLPEAKFRQCEIYIKEIALNDTRDEKNEIKTTEDEPYSRRSEIAGNSGRRFDDLDASSAGRELWRRWRESFSKNLGTLRKPDGQLGATEQRDKERASRAIEGNQRIDGEPKDNYSDDFEPEIIEFDDIADELFDIQNYDLNNILVLTHLAAAKLKQKSSDKPPEFEKPLFEIDSDLVRAPRSFRS